MNFKKDEPQPKTEMGRQMQKIWEQHHDPEYQKRKKLAREREERKKNKLIDMGFVSGKI